MIDGNEIISISTFKRFLIEKNADFVFGSYEWFKEVGLKVEYLN